MRSSGCNQRKQVIHDYLKIGDFTLFQGDAEMYFKAKSEKREFHNWHCLHTALYDDLLITKTPPFRKESERQRFIDLCEYILPMFYKQKILFNFTCKMQRRRKSDGSVNFRHYFSEIVGISCPLFCIIISLQLYWIIFD